MNDSSSSHVAIPAGSSGPESLQCMEVWGGNFETDKWFTMPGLEAWLYSKPEGDADRGGDVFYLSSCASGRITRMLLADISGHGSVVGDLGVKLRDLMRRNINHIRQTKLVEQMNDQFSGLGRQGGFATAVICSYFAPRRQLQVSIAGHPPPLYYQASKGTWSALDPGNSPKGRVADTPLGVISEAHYSIRSEKLSRGDLILCFSDAFSEAENAEGNLLGVDGLLDLVRQTDIERPETFLPTLRAKIVGLSTENLRQDDATAILLRATDSGIPLKNNLLALYRFFRGARHNVDLAPAAPRGAES